MTGAGALLPAAASGQSQSCRGSPVDKHSLGLDDFFISYSFSIFPYKESNYTVKNAFSRLWRNVIGDGNYGNSREENKEIAQVGETGVSVIAQRFLVVLRIILHKFFLWSMYEKSTLCDSIVT